LYGTLIQYAWIAHGDYPVIIDNNQACGTPIGSVTWMRASDHDTAYACVDNKQYFLLQANGPASDPPEPSNGCEITANPLVPVNGASDLVSGIWAGITTNFITSGYVFI
jgi:hypothetical protein